MRSVLFKAIPFRKEEAILALESGADGLIVPPEHVETAASLARCQVRSAADTAIIALSGKNDEEEAAQCMAAAGGIILARGWEVIPAENLLARHPSASLGLEAATVEEARLAAGILERGADTIVIPPQGIGAVKAIAAAVKYVSGSISLREAVVTEITRTGMGHRVCVDTMSILNRGQGMLVGNSAAFLFLVNAETERNEYVASRPFRVNAGGVHAYALLPGDATRYLEELRAGSEVLIAGHNGDTQTAIVGRVKVEVRPMLFIKARLSQPGNEDGQEGALFLQNAETIRLVQPGGNPISVVALREGDHILCRSDSAGRHFGMRIAEDITEV